jgi:hypothetical protein
MKSNMQEERRAQVRVDGLVLKVNSMGYSTIPEIFMEVINYLVHHYIDDFQPT